MSPGREETKVTFWYSELTSPFQLSCYFWCPAGQAQNQINSPHSSAGGIWGKIWGKVLQGQISVQDTDLGDDVVISTGVMYSLTQSGPLKESEDGKENETNFAWSGDAAECKGAIVCPGTNCIKIGLPGKSILGD